MKKSVSPHGSPNTLSIVGRDKVTQRSNAPGSCGELPGVLFSASALTRSERLVMEQRIETLKRFQALMDSGMSQAAAARELRVSVPTIWRWSKHGVAPRFSRCGRKSLLNLLNPPAQVFRRVRELQLAGKSNAAAWKAVAEEPVCPPSLAQYLRGCKTIAARLLAATKLIRCKAVILKCQDFTVIKE